MWTILKLLGRYSQIIGGIYPPSPPCFGTPDVLELRTGHFRGLAGFEAKAKDLKLCPQGQGHPRGHYV